MSRDNVVEQLPKTTNKISVYPSQISKGGILIGYHHLLPFLMKKKKCNPVTSKNQNLISAVADHHCPLYRYDPVHFFLSHVQNED